MVEQMCEYTNNHLKWANCMVCDYLNKTVLQKEDNIPPCKELPIEIRN